MNEVKQLKDLIQLPVRVQNTRYIFDQNRYIAEMITPEIATAICNELNRGVEVDVEKAAGEYAKKIADGILFRSISLKDEAVKWIKDAFIAGSSLLRNGWVSVEDEPTLPHNTEYLAVVRREVLSDVYYEDGFWWRHKDNHREHLENVSFYQPLPSHSPIK